MQIYMGQMRPCENQPSMPKHKGKQKKSTRNALLSSLEIRMYSTAIPKEPTACGLRQWLNTWKPLLLRSIQDGITTGTNCTHSICNFFSPFQLLEFAQLNWIVIFTPLTGGRAHRSTIRWLCRWRRGSVLNRRLPFFNNKTP